MTLLEVLLGVLVLALGVLAGAALQIRALQATDSARRDTQASHLAQALVERVRAAGGLQSADLLQWQREVQASLGAQARGRARHTGALLVVDVDWPDPRDQHHQGISLQARP
ncbi:type IV pilus modification protein PilV [Pseudomonas sp. BP8]|uniref:type IV pilus modification protein PilV n=1 Tax=Pseudomonas sp. BP8 TaxID=2817864 RepID=UPI001AE77B66|nr:type IV pilus modification protein PilV [Pseudomonas sp. BP8]MBP2264265.1 type IV pilus assembly protein PilV [Pseudomonas sp. BP8]HDS1734826.1 type IV pilus modification protein PilV [Pseudomonas putida]